MKSDVQKDGQKPPAGDGVEQPGEAPVVSLDQARQKRRQRAAEAQAEYAARTKKLFQLEQDLHRAVLQHAIATQRMLFSDLVDLIKLGIITDDPEHLPCEVHTRDQNYQEWEAAYYGEDAADPDADLITDLIQRLKQGGVDTRQVVDMEESQSRKVPPANKVFCPMYSYGEDADPPCVKALESRQATRFEDGRMVFYDVPYDPEDSVVKSRLHPCVFLGRELYRVVMPGAWGQGLPGPQQDEQGDPDAGDEADKE